MFLFASTTIALDWESVPAVAPIILFILCNEESVNSSVPTNNLFTLRSLYDVIVTLLVVLSVSVVFTTAK